MTEALGKHRSEPSGNTAYQPPTIEKISKCG